MELGAFSISLAVKDLAASQAFYERLGFSRTGGGEGYAILANGTTLIGLFQGMFDENILTFNPGLTNDQRMLERFTDVRALQAALADEGMAFEEKADPDGDGPAHFIIVDPDGNPILVDQHVPRPKPSAD